MAIQLTVVGAAGRMGRRIIALAAQSDYFHVVGALESRNHPDLDKDAGELAGVGPLGIALTDSCPAGAQVVIDFSLPDAADYTIEFCQSSGTALVMGTTGLNAAQRQKIDTLAQSGPVVYATNMSVGMNVLFALVGKAAAMLGPEYDIEIVEQHHRFKKDAPSGSALTLAEKICQATGRKTDDTLVHGRVGKDALRTQGTIGMHAVRAGDVTGVHSVICSTLGETVTLNHTAHSRDTFVRGALRAAQWLVDKPPGRYTMADVLGIE